MYLDLNKKAPEAAALADDTGTRLTYGALCGAMRDIGFAAPSRSLIFCMCKNRIGAALGYLAFVEGGQVPLLLGANTDGALLGSLVKTYAPAYIWYPDDMQLPIPCTPVYGAYGYILARTGNAAYAMNEQLRLLLPTSGSTGSPKLVRHSYGNLCASAANVAEAFCIASEDRALLELPIQYTMGLSVLSSHLHAGACAVLTERGLMSMELYTKMEDERITSFTGVPYSYEILARVRFTRSPWPHLKALCVGGGKMPEERVREFASYCQTNGKRFISSYGQTECTARMAILQPEHALDKIGSIGKAMPGGRLYLIDDEGAQLEGAAEGEMCYEGPNVTMGYATCREDLLKGDEWHGIRHTGDIAKRDADGFYYITGRISRFLKIYGVRVSLDECESLILGELGVECACAGTDKRMLIYLTDAGKTGEVVQFLSDTTGLLRTAFHPVTVERIPRSETGKVLYAALSALSQ